MGKRKDQFKLNVISEIKALKKNATQEEISKLDFEKLDVSNSFRCIYGQMTGSCRSDRAEELTPKIYRKLSVEHDKEYGTKKYSLGNSFTALERYIYKASKKKNKAIINYLKNAGEMPII